MKETKKTKGSTGTKGTKQKAKVEKKLHGVMEANTKLMEETMKKLAGIAPDVETVPRKRYTGFKINGRLLSSIMGQKYSFDMSIHEYSEKGTHVNTVHSEILPTAKDVGEVVAGLLAQVKTNYCLLKEASKKKKKAKPKKKVTKTEPKKETKKETKKEEPTRGCGGI